MTDFHDVFTWGRSEGPRQVGFNAQESILLLSFVLMREVFGTHMIMMAAGFGLSAGVIVDGTRDAVQELGHVQYEAGVD